MERAAGGARVSASEKEKGGPFAADRGISLGLYSEAADDKRPEWFRVCLCSEAADDKRPTWSSRAPVFISHARRRNQRPLSVMAPVFVIHARSRCKRPAWSVMARVYASLDSSRCKRTAWFNRARVCVIHARSTPLVKILLHSQRC